jgi:hypothetical protein
MTDAMTSREHELTTRVTVLEEQLKAMREAKELQAKEYERRLTDLNHAHERQVEDQATFVSADKFEGFQGEINQWRNTVTITLADLAGKSAGIGSARGLVVQVITIVISMVTIAVIFWSRLGK